MDRPIGSFATNSMKIEATYEKLRAEILGVVWGRVFEVQVVQHLDQGML